MENSNLKIIDQFFDAYSKRDFTALCEVLTENVRWTALGQHPLSGVHNGVEELVAFFDGMGAVMAESNPRVEKLVVGENQEYVVECQHVWTNREDGFNLDHLVCVLWRFENGKIAEGTHFFADPRASDVFFNKVLSEKGKD